MCYKRFAQIKIRSLFMKFKLLSLVLSLVVGSAASATTYVCFPPKNNQNAFFSDSTVLVNVEPGLLRLLQFNKWSKASLMRDYGYAYKGLAGGNSKVTGMMMFTLVKEFKSYGDNIQTLYVAPALATGGEGPIMFSGQGFSWDWNFCKRN